MSEQRKIRNLDAETLLDLDLSGTKLIEASAGTGKTHTIADLYLRQILEGRQVSEILIVTYTNAATEELRGRIRRRLYQASNYLQDSGDDGDPFLALLHQAWRNLEPDSQAVRLRRLELALRSMDEAAISTIHSFCQRSLQNYALSGNQLFETEMRANDDPLWEAAIRDWWRKQTYTLERGTWAIVRNALDNVEALTSCLLELRSRPSAKLLPAPCMALDELLRQPREIAHRLHRLAPVWQQQRAQIIEIISTSPALSRAKTLPYHPNELPGFFAATDRFFDSSEPLVPFDRFEYMGTGWLHQNSVKSRRGQDANLEHSFFQALDDIATDWLAFNETLAAQLLATAFEYARKTVLEVKRDTAVLAFQDQLTLLLDALESSSGTELARNLRQRYPVAMIDEFQDTDDIQYRIFSKIYLSADDVSLTLIGDPKQAIYSFRGGDIFTYMQARSLSSVDLYSLQTNWRSQPRLVTAVNTLFSQRSDPFIYQDSIEFKPVSAVDENWSHALRFDHEPAAGMTLWQLPRKLPVKNYSRDEMRDLINRAILAEINTLLDSQHEASASIEGRPVRSGDIAILVRQASEGQVLSQLLQKQGIATVTIGRDSVFHSEEARGLYLLLSAISQYQDNAFASRSLGSSLLGLDYRQIADIVDNDASWQAWVDDLAELHQQWERHGFITMFQSLLQRFNLASALAQRDNNERRITNLIHLAELLQQQSTASAGISPLLGWFCQQFDEPASEEAELRLEGDESLVKIVTIHKAKGLQYPIVFVPFLWSCRQVDKDGAVYFHDQQLAPCFDLGSAARRQNWISAEKERLAEDLRLLYVALTRARSRVYLAWGQAGNANRSGYASQTALAYLLHSRQAPADLDLAAADGFPAGMDFEADLQRLIDRSEASIELRPLPELARTKEFRQITLEKPDLGLARFSRADLHHWRINSFTALTRGIHQPPNTGAIAEHGDPILEFPAGSHIGLLLHSLLENLDFQSGIESQCEFLFPRFMPGAGLSGEYEPTLLAWLECILKTPLDGQALKLDQLSSGSRLNELEFDFALDHLDIRALNRFMQSLSPLPLMDVSSPEFGGLITGVIDLVFEHQGRYYLADYKSNFLGASLADYQPSKLLQAMLDRRYDLQSLIYCVALHRYLEQRLPDYDYAHHFGGSYYLFLRGMRPQQANRYGIHFERPELEVMMAFDQLLGFTPQRGTAR